MMVNNAVCEERSGGFERFALEQELIGTSLCALYQAATCHRKCWNTGHVFESICGRAHNLGASAFKLIRAGYYDEALNLVRAIGETYNIVLLSVFDKVAFAEWMKADKKARLRNFSPVKVRLLLDATDCEGFMDEEWYSELCEKYVHVSTRTMPNFHNDKTPIVGGVFQERGQKESLDSLSSILTMLAMFVCRYFEYDDLLNIITNHANGMRDDAGIKPSH